MLIIEPIFSLDSEWTNKSFSYARQQCLFCFILVHGTYVHITRGSAGQLALTVLEGIMERLRHQGRPRRQWIHDIEEWTGCEYIQLKEMSQDRAQWRRVER